MGRREEQQALAHVRERLATSFPHIPAQRVSDAVEESTHSFDTARVRDFIPLLVEKDARELLRSGAESGRVDAGH